MFENAVSTRGTRVINVTSPMCRFIRPLLYIVCTNGTFPVVSSALVSQYLAYWWIPFLSFFLSRAKILNPLSLRSEKIQTEIHKTIIIHTDWIIIHFNILKRKKKIILTVQLGLSIYPSFSSAYFYPARPRLTGWSISKIIKPHISPKLPSLKQRMQISRGTSSPLEIVRASRSATDVFNYSIKTRICRYK